MKVRICSYIIHLSLLTLVVLASCNSTGTPGMGNDPGGARVVSAPVITPDGGSFDWFVEATITADPGAEIHYTTDGSDPHQYSRRYTEPIYVETGMTVKAIAVVDDLEPSEVSEVEFSPNHQLRDNVIQAIYDEVHAPYEYGVVLEPSRLDGAGFDWDYEMIDNPHVFREDGFWYMTYVGFDGTGYSTGLARSTDLLDWEKLGVILEPGAPGSWDDSNAAGYIARDHTWGSAPIPLRSPVDNAYLMTYLGSGEPGYENGTTRMGIATTDSLFQEGGNPGPPKIWSRLPENPLLSPKWELERDKIWKSQLHLIDGRWELFYNGGLYDFPEERILIAHSNDLSNWTRYEHNPVITESTDESGGAWGAVINGDPDVVKIGDYWVMFYFADTPTPHGIVDTFAVSPDRIHWFPSHKILRTTDESYNENNAHKPNVIKHEGVVYHFYTAVYGWPDDTQRVIALARSVE